MTDEVRYDHLRQLYSEVSERQYAYGKWLLASLLAVHAGSLLAISQAGAKTGALYSACGPLLISGVALALMSGGLAWINFTTAMTIYANSMAHLMKGETYNLSSSMNIFINVTLWGAPLLASTSLFVFIIAAFKATSVLHN